MYNRQLTADDELQFENLTSLNLHKNGKCQKGSQTDTESTHIGIALYNMKHN